MFARKRDWYVVEWRNWTSDAITPNVYRVPDFGFDDLSLRACKLTIQSRRSNSVTLEHESDETANITQTAFEDVSAARLFFRKQSSLVHYGPTFDKLYLWRTVAATRKKALMLPLLNYHDRQAELLLEYPRGYARPEPTE